MSKEKQDRAHWLYKGKPLKVLSTSMGLVLLANLAFTPIVIGETTNPSSAKLVEWSSDEVQSFFDPVSDWNVPLPNLSQNENASTASPSPSPTGSGGSSGGNTTIVHSGGGFGWSDLLLYHMIFNRGGVYSSNQYYANRPAYVSGTNTTYKPKSYEDTSFQNKTRPNSQIRPKTSTSTGSVVRRSTSGGKSTSSSAGGIGGKSSGLGSSSGKSSSSGSSSGGFGG
ncbi:hypothetical protein [Paenibacillus sp. KN14-4R]|uniref:hypothetical protein n=1 Tax=Paenibacillus sp. KN14-4R TaxID=3445773 RepID=UPI003FA0D567